MIYHHSNKNIKAQNPDSPTKTQKTDWGTKNKSWKMVQHKDLMKFPLQFWLGLLCYCCGTQSTSILPVLLSLAVVEDTRATCPGVPIYIQEDMCRSHPSCPQPLLAYFYFEWIDLYHRTCHHCLSVCWWEWPGCFNLFKEWFWSSAAATSGSLVLLAPRVGGPGSAWPSAFVLAMFLHQSGSLAWLGERSWTDDWDA